MSEIKEGIKKIGIHIFLMVAALLVLLFTFFNVYLPNYTHHGEAVTVPDLEGFQYDELERFLNERNLELKVTADSGFVADIPPLQVLKQNPKAGAKVKQNRKIYVTLNAANPPLVQMPNLINTPLKNAQEILSNYGLVRGEIVYVPDIARNVVLEQKYRGRNIKEGMEIAKGSQIDLVVGDGLGNQTLSVPNLLGMDEAEAEFLVVGSGLRMGSITYVPTDTVPKGTILQQLPPAGVDAKTGEIVDLWISEIGNVTDF
ncbi:MAG TPA: PASTA domain-containing protein [Cyclobacteriaceae bacterium]|nr:PASTA domain-containing protein [Cyclobacteriaceae bacterium]